MKEKIMEKLEIPKELFSDIPKITWIGNDDLTCENCGGLLTCEETVIRFSTGIGILTISGIDLCIGSLSDNLVVIGGKINGICYE